MRLQLPRLRRTALRILIVTSLLYACSSDSEGGAPTAQEAVGPAVRGTVTSAAGGPVEGVTVSAGGQTATTNAQGQYTLRAGAGEKVLRFTKGGFVDGLERLNVGSARATQLDAVLLPAAAPVPLDAATGGEIATTRGAKVLVPPNALVDKNGAPVTGQVSVVLTPIDPSKEAEVRAAPGEFLAAQGGQPTMIESFGMVDITIQRGGDKLQVAPGKELELRIPAPEGGTPPPTTTLWSFDEAKGLWVDEGTATYDPATRTYVAKAKHMSFWNADEPYTSTCVRGVVFDKLTNQPLAGARVVAAGTSYFGTSETSTDDQGNFYLAVRKDSDVSVAAYHKSGGGEARAIKSGGSDTPVPVVPGPACADIGRWNVEKDVFVDTKGNATRCEAALNEFTGTCAEGFFSAFGTCYQPSGECVARFGSSDGSFSISYANGARMEGTEGSFKFYGPGGALCATLTSAASGGDRVTSTFTLPSGESFGQESSPDDSIIFRCPNGQTVTFTAEQQRRAEACTGDTSGEQQSGGSDDGQSCRFEGPDGGSLGPGQGGLGARCTGDPECTGGNVCCDLQSSKICYPRDACDQIRAGQR